MRSIALFKTQDSLGNIVTIDYDNLGHRTAVDPDLANYHGVDAFRARTVKQVSPTQRKAGTATTARCTDDLGRMVARRERD